MGTLQNPYEADAAKIPETDRYQDLPCFGRYLPRADDFKPDRRYFNSTSTKSRRYWASVLKLCDESVRIYDNQDGGRDVFALGSVIVKSSHLKALDQGRDYSYADANEVKAVALAREVVKDIRVPCIYFASKVRLCLSIL